MSSITSEKPWYQWDTGLEVTVGDGIDQVHFAGSRMGRSLDVDVSGGRARVPDTLLQSARPVRAWGYEVDGSGGRTLVAAEFPVIPRNRPAGYAFTPTDQAVIADAVKAASKAASARDEARRYAGEANDSSVAAGDEADRATERAKDAEAAEGRAQDAANEAARHAERAKASADAASGSAETVANGLADEAKTRADADARITEDLATETTRATKAETTIDQKLTGMLNGLSNALSTVGGNFDKAIGKETSDRKATDSKLEADYKAADVALGTKLSADMAAINANLGTRVDAVASVAPLVVKVENNVPAKTFDEMQQAMLAGRPVYWTDGLLTFAAVQMEHGGLRARVGLNVSGGAIASATFWELAPNAAEITESDYSV